jgi:hypothetical protein
MLHWLRRRLYRENTAALVALLSPGIIAAENGRDIEALISIYGPAMDRGFSAKRTPEQTALAVVGALIDGRVRQATEAERQRIGTEMRNVQVIPMRPTSRWFVFVVDTAMEWERMTKVHRGDIDAFRSAALSNLPYDDKA